MKAFIVLDPNGADTRGEDGKATWRDDALHSGVKYAESARAAVIYAIPAWRNENLKVVDHGAGVWAVIPEERDGIGVIVVEVSR